MKFVLVPKKDFENLQNYLLKKPAEEVMNFLIESSKYETTTKADDDNDPKKD